jgi:hypothetical protein
MQLSTTLTRVVDMARKQAGQVWGGKVRISSVNNMGSKRRVPGHRGARAYPLLMESKTGSKFLF